MFELRPYQAEAIRLLKQIWEKGELRVVLCAPTGSGKTVIAADLIQKVADSGGRAHFICDRESLIRQTSERLAEWGLEHGVAQGPNTFGKTRDIQILSAQTIAARGIELDADLTIVDECHIIHKAVTRQLVDSGKPAVGLSATPFREGLGQIWESIVNVETTQRLVNEGWLARVKIYCGTPVEVGRKNSSGEFDTSDTSGSTLKIVGDILEEWESKTKLHFGGPVKTIAFANRVADAEQLAQKFRDAGHEFRAVSYMDAPEERRTKIEGHRRAGYPRPGLGRGATARLRRSRHPVRHRLPPLEEVSHGRRPTGGPDHAGLRGQGICTMARPCPERSSVPQAAVRLLAVRLLETGRGPGQRGRQG